MMPITENGKPLLPWWGYVHENFSLQVKRFWDDDDSLVDARQSPFVLHVFDVFYAQNRQDAIKRLEPEYMQFLKSYQEI